MVDDSGLEVIRKSAEHLKPGDKSEYLLRTKTIFGDSPNLDAFSRLRISTPQSIFDSSFQYNIQPLTWDKSLTGGAGVAHDANQSAAKLSTTTANGDKAIFQTFRAFHYQPGKGQLVAMTGNFDSTQTNSVKRIGQFDTNNGWFFKVSGQTISVVVRSKISGAPVNTEVSQSSWNVDKLDGAGVSGVTLDLTKQQFYFIDYTWFGTGRVRFGFFIGGKFIVVHEFNHSNLISTPYSQTATLPLRVELENTGATISASNFYLTCAALISEGDYDPDGHLFSGNSGTTAKTLGATAVPVLSLRKATAFLTVPVRLVGVNPFIATADDILWSITVNPALTGATFATALGSCEIDSAATAITGGHVLHSFYQSAQANGVSTADIGAQILAALDAWLGSSIAGVSDIITLSCVSLTAAAQGYAAMTWKEYN